MKITELRRHLKELTRDQLMEDVVDLFRKDSFVNDYYTIKCKSGESISILENYKLIIENEFFPINGFGKARLSVAKKAISEFKKLSQDKKAIAELMLFYVETGVRYTDCYGDIYESFYFSMESMFKRAVDFIVKHSLEDRFKDRCRQIVNDTVNMGWGFHDELCDIYYGYFED